MVARQRCTGGCNEFGAAAFDEITGLRNDALKDFENLAHAGTTIDDVTAKGRREGRKTFLLSFTSNADNLCHRF